jgi:nitrate reductase NapA
MGNRQRGDPTAHVDRRDFLKIAAVASATIAATPLRAETLQSGEGEWKRTPCRMCGVGCGLLVHIKAGRAVAVKGDPASPVSRGMACVKGYYSVQALYGRDRLTRALIRKDGRLVPASLSEALDLVAARLRDTRTRFGPDSVALYGSAQWTAADAYIGARLFRGALGSRNVDTSARLHTASADAGYVGTYGLPGPPGGYEDIDHADVFVLWNVNLAETDPVLFSRMLERRRTSPAVRIIELATRTTRTSYAADRAFVIAPGSELIIANAICQEIVAREMASRDFIDRHVAFKRGAADVAGDSADDVLRTDQASDVRWEDFVRFLSDQTPARAQQISGLAASEIRWLASVYADPARTVVSAWGANVNRQGRGTWVNNALHNIHLLVNKVASPGNASIALTGQPGGAALASDALGHRAGPVNEEGRGRIARAWGSTPDRVDSRQARPALSIFRALDRGDVRFVWIQATNPMASLPNLSRFRAAARRDGRFVVVSEAYPTPTTDVADVVLPAAMWFERDGDVVNAERRIQHVAQLVRPPGDCLSDLEQMIEVARRLGYGSMFAWDGSTRDAQIWEELRRLHNEQFDALPPLAMVEAATGVLWPAPGGHETRWRYNTTHDPAASKSLGRFDFYGHDDHRAWIWLRPYEPPAESPDRDYPLWFSTGSVVEHWGTGSMTRRIPSLHQAVPRTYVEINRADARARGIRDGDTVRLTSRRGSVEVEARIDYRSQPPRGCVFAPSFDEATAVNLLTGDSCCPISGQPDYGACAVRVDRVGGTP